MSSRSEFYEHFVPNKMTNIQPTFAPTAYPDFSDTPLNIYNNYHHHYYYPNNHNLDTYQSSIDHTWIRKFECDNNQKEFFIANTPSPAEFCDFEVPQQQFFSKAPKVDAEKFFFDSPKVSTTSAKDLINNNNFVENYKILSWESEKSSVKSEREATKITQKIAKVVKLPSSSDAGECYLLFEN
jgi:hypothetical protein